MVVGRRLSVVGFALDSVAVTTTVDPRPTTDDHRSSIIDHPGASVRGPDGGTRMLVADVLGCSRDPNVAPLDAAATDVDADVSRVAKRAIDRIELGQ